jgi:2-phosphosulfolactate phosphatase
MTRVHVVMRKEEVEPRRLAGKTVVVLDVLFATSSIVTALAHGASEVVPALDAEEARTEAARRPPGSYVLAGEAGAETLSGFVPAWPLEVARAVLPGRALVYSTTNGTVALRRAAGAGRVYAASLLNAAAVVERVQRDGSTDGVLVVCAGSDDRFNLEDYYGAGYLVSLLVRGRRNAWDLSDAALAAQLMHDGTGDGCLARSAVGRFMCARGLEREVAFASQKDRFDVVPQLVASPAAALATPPVLRTSPSR